MERQYAKTIVDYLYDEGDRDIIFFGFIIGVVSFDREDAPYEKSKPTDLTTPSGWQNF